MQYARKAIQPPGKAKENWKILRALSEKLGSFQIGLNLNGLRNALFDEFPLISKPNEIIEAPWKAVEKQKKLVSKYHCQAMSRITISLIAFVERVKRWVV